MRDIVLVTALAIFLPLCVRFPAAGLACWIWLGLMSPHRQIYGFAAAQPLNSVIAVATLVGWLVSTERKRWPADLTPWLMLILFVWISFNALFSPDPDQSWKYWNLITRIFVFVFMVLFVINTKVRIHGMIWALVISIGYYSVKGGIFTLRNGGSYTVVGPEATMIADNNHMALAAVMLLPVMNYLRMHTRMPLVRTGMSIAIGFQILMILGSKSRGAAIALAITLGIFLLRSRNKIVYAVIGVIVVGAALKFMPESYFERLNTINNLDADDSFQGRVQAWKVATMIAFDKFPFGAGIYVPQTAAVYQSYLPGAKPHAAHSIYFQMLGENGFIGLGLYLGLLASGLYNTIVVMQQSRRNPQLRWAYDLANMTLVSLIGFYVGGAALSLAYYDGLLMMIALMSTLRALTAPATAANALRTEAARAQGPPRYAGPAAAPPGRGKPISARTP